MVTHLEDHTYGEAQHKLENKGLVQVPWVDHTIIMKVVVVNGTPVLGPKDNLQFVVCGVGRICIPFPGLGYTVDPFQEVVHRTGEIGKTGRSPQGAHRWTSVTARKQEHGKSSFRHSCLPACRTRGSTRGYICMGKDHSLPPGVT